MSILAVLAVAVTLGAVVAVSAREPRASLIGLVVALALAPFLADPLPGIAALGARMISGILVVFVLRAVASRGEAGEVRSRLGWPAEIAFAAIGLTAAVAIRSTLLAASTGGGPDIGGAGPALDTGTAILGAGLASVLIGLAPAFTGGSALRTTIGLLVVANGIVLVRTGIAGPPTEVDQLGIDGLVLTIGMAGALLMGLELRDAERRARPLAHPGDRVVAAPGRESPRTDGWPER